MAIALSLAAAFGKPAAEALLKRLSSRPNAAQKMEQATRCMAEGVTAIDAMKQAFGSEFLADLSEALGGYDSARFSYQAGTSSYIQLNTPGASPLQVLRDELNINLDRLAALDANTDAVRNQFAGLMSVWMGRCRHLLPAEHLEDINATEDIVKRLLSGDLKNYRQVYEQLSRTGLGAVGALLLLAGVFAATTTGVGLVAMISTFLFGIPWLTVGALVVPGALLIALAARKTSKKDVISLAVAMSYKLIERLEKATPQPITNKGEV